MWGMSDEHPDRPTDGAALPDRGVLFRPGTATGDRPYRTAVPLSGSDDIRRAWDSLDDDGFLWISLASPTTAEMRAVADVLHIHDLIVEDAVTARQRPKLERYGSQVLVVLRTIAYTRDDDAGRTPDVSTGEVLVILGDRFVVTVSHGRVPDPLERLTHDLARDFRPHTVLYTATDLIVDHYTAVADEMEDDINELENAVFAPDGHFSIQDVYLMMREVLEVRHAIDPLTPPMQRLLTEPDLFSGESHSYFRDVVDHQVHAADRVRNFAERLRSLVDAASAKITLQQNTDMRKMSAWAGIALVPTIVAAIYGMNFEKMPELTWPFGYPLCLLAMLAVCGWLLFLFRRNKWL
ncbi:MAG TPA: magnesium and cobalt transport protein CorA [Corynebacterium nuruki]|uniref:Magnesium and cobalt transport protein CorA n=2 Tax=Corynebacterium nuruki TaxID=1032851 RepID=A0A3D4SXH8_9CORY|nr:magnesium and cobalt transport protein CorA [Corynebacterium nuruki]